MKNSEIEDLKNELWIDFLNLGEKFGNRMNIPVFFYFILLYSFKLGYDCAPNKDIVKELTQLAMKRGYEWHLDEIQEASAKLQGDV